MLIKPRALIIMVASLAALGCESSAPKAQDPVEDAPAREATPRDRAARAQAELGLVQALDLASMTALRDVEKDLKASQSAVPTSIDTDAAKKFSVIFAANNHGEREDCGCRKNPLGGLARRHTLVDVAADRSEGGRWWGAVEWDNPVFHVDAGDSLFANTSLSRASPNAKDVALHDARAVVAALNEVPPVAMLAGELDFTLGPKVLMDLAKRAKFPFISANVQGAEGPLFPGHVVAEKGGVKVAFVGVTKPASRHQDFWKTQGLTVGDPLAALQAELAKLPAVDAVVLLSNLGVPETEKLVTAARQAGAKLHLGIVSNSNRLTADPVYVSGVPIVEPLSRGKYLGRADVWLNGDELSYRSAAGANLTMLQEYRRALRSYYTARKQQLRDRVRLEEMHVEAADVKARVAQTPDAGQAVQRLKERRQRSIEGLEKRLKTQDARITVTSERLLGALRGGLQIDEEVSGDDWLSLNIVQVKLDIPEAKPSRKVLDRAKETRPKEEASPRPRGPADILPEGVGNPSKLLRPKGPLAPGKPKPAATQGK